MQLPCVMFKTIVWYMTLIAYHAQRLFQLLNRIENVEFEGDNPESEIYKIMLNKRQRKDNGQSHARTGGSGVLKERGAILREGLKGQQENLKCVFFCLATYKESIMLSHC